jgi:arylsulfatase A-like enzyme
MKRRSFISLCAAATAAATLAAAKRPPNVVIIYGDDVGFGDVGAYGSKMIPTPNIDRLAREGLRFTDGHCSAATCTPSRYSLLTGIHGFRDGVSILPPNAPLSISTDILTLPKLFRQAGYATGVVGKWHLGIGQKKVPTDWNGDVKPGPMEIGFDSSFLLPSTNDRVPCVYLDGHRVVNLDPSDPLYVGRSKAAVDKPGSTVYPDARQTPEAMTYYKSTHGHNHSVINGIGRIGYMAGGKSALWNDETMADEFVKQAKKYIAANKDQPFFLYFASQDIHVPRAPHPRFQGTTGLGYRGDAMVQFDWSTGQIMKALEQHGLTDNTIVIFSSDNGPVYDDGYDDGTTVQTSTEEVDRGHDGSGIYRGGKYQIYEGGTRVPLIIRWPQRIQPGTSDALVNQIDFIASFADLLDIDLPENEARDSRNTLNAFLGNDPKGLDFMIEEAGKRRALRRGDWKYIAPAKSKKKKNRGAGPGAELYNLKTDPGEQNNLIADHPEKAEALAAELKALMDAGRVRK